MQKHGEQRIYFAALAVFILALALRILHIAAVYRNSPFFDVLPGDLGAYDRWAVRIVEQGWLGHEIFYQDPLYPYFLAIFYKIFGRDFYWIYIAQSVMGAWTAMLLVLLGNRIFSTGAGVVGGLLYAIYGPAIYFDGLLLKVTLSAFLFTQALYFLMARGFEKPGTKQFFGGLFLGLACLTRANFLLLLPVVFLAFFVSKKSIIIKRLAMALLFLAGVLAVLGPVAVRNYLVGDELVLTTAQAGQNFFIGHNPEANGTYIMLPFVHPDPAHEQVDFRKEAEKRAGREMKPTEVSRYWLQQGLDYIRHNPWTDLKLTGKKFLLFLNSYEIPDNHNYYFHKRYSAILQILPIHFGLVAPFFLLGLLGMITDRRLEPLVLLAVQATYIISVIIFYVFARYRMVAMPLFCLSAGYGVTSLLNQFRQGQWRRFAMGLLIIILGFAVAELKIMAPFDFSHSFTDEGLAYEMKDKPKRALKSYEKALEINPDYLRALKKLGKLQLQLKMYESARLTYTKILSLEPGSIDAKYQIMLLDKRGL